MPDSPGLRPVTTIIRPHRLRTVSTVTPANPASSTLAARSSISSCSHAVASGTSNQVLGDDGPPSGRKHPQQLGQAGVWVHPVVERGDGPRHGESFVLKGDVLRFPEPDVGGGEAAAALADEAWRGVHPRKL